MVCRAGARRRATVHWENGPPILLRQGYGGQASGGPTSDCIVPVEAPWTTFSRLTKLPIASASTLTAAAGYLASARQFHAGIFSMLLGILLLAMASCALNELQERHLDARMERTAKRPLPSGKISPAWVLTLILALAFSGFDLLLLHGWSAAILGLAALVWYNGIYTPLKRWTPFAVVPGALIGAIPPAIGWTAAGGSWSDPGMLALCLVFFLWQVPHFWLLFLRHEHDYTRAGFPCLSARFTPRQSRRILFIWTTSVICACGLLPAFRVLQSLLSTGMIAIGGLWLGFLAASLLRTDLTPRSSSRLFAGINLFALLLTAAVALDPFFVL
jgi:protoheme IX farnesyltransferase